MADEYKNLRILVCTWNVGCTEPLNDHQLECMLQLKESKHVDVYAIGLQEIKTGARETVNSFINYDDWAKQLSAFLSPRGYYMIENIRVQGISLCLFALFKHLPYIRFIRTEIERTGIAGAWGNKGGVAISCWLYGQQVCFLNVHLSAHLNNMQERINDVKEIFKEMGFGGKSSVLSHDLVLMFGDMNFRIDDFPREFIIETIAKKNYSVLWEQDQLKKNMKTDEIFSQFQDGVLNFDPTYKYDPGTDTYDTSSKKRKPAWTDRILWRIHPEAKLKNRGGPPFIFDTVENSYHSIPSLKQSDHRPVTSQFNLKILNAALHEPLLRIEPEGTWARDQDGELKVEYYEGMEWSSRDYIGLYKDDVKDFRSYESYIYVSKHDDSSSSSSSSSDSDDEPDGNVKSKKSSRKVEKVEDDLIKCLRFKKSQIKESGTYRLGYYSTNMSCLSAMSLPFEVK